MTRKATAMRQLAVAIVVVLLGGCVDHPTQPDTNEIAPNVKRGGRPGPPGQVPVSALLRNAPADNLLGDSASPYVDGECGVLSVIVDDGRYFLAPASQRIHKKDEASCPAVPRFIDVVFRVVHVSSEPHVDQSLPAGVVRL